jgi:hypothetical protein
MATPFCENERRLEKQGLAHLSGILMEFAAA